MGVGGGEVGEAHGTYAARGRVLGDEAHMQGHDVDITQER